MTSTRSLDAWLAYIQTVHFRSIDMTLDRVADVLERLMNPPSFRIIAVAGTNGKGSCAAMLGSILASCGWRAGVYSSPHLTRFNERIRVDDAEAEDGELCAAFERIEACRGEVPLTYFEFATLAAVDVFQRRGVDYAIMEIGMGGRLDAVNALSIDASLITNVELDHMRWLGRDREAIGFEKAHIMRPGRVSVYNDPRPPRSVLDYAERIETRLFLAGRDYDHEALETGWLWRGPRGESWRLAALPVPGRVQIANAAGALALLSVLNGQIGLDQQRAASGLANTRIRGRCEIVARRPMVVVDVGHNPSAIETLAGHLAANPVGGKTTAVFGMLKDKEPAPVIEALGGEVDAWCFAGIQGARGQSADELARLVTPHIDAPYHCHDSAVEAYRCARRHSGADDRILVFGSFHIAGDILDYLERPS